MCESRHFQDLSRASRALCLIKEPSSPLKHQLQLSKLAVCALEAFTVGIHLKQVALKFLQMSLQCRFFRGNESTATQIAFFSFFSFFFFGRGVLKK